jgi:hypothetical protein
MRFPPVCGELLILVAVPLELTDRCKPKPEYFL